MESLEDGELPDYDDGKRDESILWQVYVLELEDGYYYVGIAFDVAKRFQEHLAEEGANFTRLHKPIRIVEQLCSGTCSQDKARKLEDEKTLEYALKYGAEKVKGGRYFIPSKLMRKVKHLQVLDETKRALPKPSSANFTRSA